MTASEPILNGNEGLGRWHLDYGSQIGGEPDEIVGGETYQGSIWFAKRGQGNYASQEIRVADEEEALRIVEVLNDAEERAEELLRRARAAERERDALVAWACPGCGARFASVPSPEDMGTGGRCSSCLEIERLRSKIAALEDEKCTAEDAAIDLRAQIRRLIVMAFNSTLNRNGGIGVGDEVAASLRQQLRDSLVQPVKPWMHHDYAVSLADYDQCRAQRMAERKADAARTGSFEYPCCPVCAAPLRQSTHTHCQGCDTSVAPRLVQLKTSVHEPRPADASHLWQGDDNQMVFYREQGGCLEATLCIWNEALLRWGTSAWARVQRMSNGAKAIRHDLLSE